MKARSGVVGLPSPSRNPPPAYPRIARQRGWEGEVLLKLSVSSEGQVEQVAIVRSSGHAVLDRAAVRAVRRWLFRPAHRDEVAVASEVVQPVRFTLPDS